MPLFETMIDYYRLNPWEYIRVIFNQYTSIFFDEIEFEIIACKLIAIFASIC